MKVILLGTGTSTGVPVIGCSCAVCKSTDPKNHRYRSSIAIQLDGDDDFLIVDTTPEFRLQVLREKITNIKGVFFTHMHADHTQGFDDLRAFQFQQRDRVLPIFLGKEYLEEFRKRFYYAFDNTGYQGVTPTVDLRGVEVGSQIMCGVKVKVIKVPHGHVNSYGLKIGRFLYLTDFKGISKGLIKELRGEIDVMVASGVHFRDHKTHSTIPETCRYFEELGVKRGIITHLSHEVDYVSHSDRLPEGIVFGFDGMTIDL